MINKIKNLFKNFKRRKDSYIDKNVLIEFLNMPCGSSDEVFQKFMQFAPHGIYKEDTMNIDSRFLYIPGTRKASNRVCLVAHADTVENGRSFENSSLKIENNIISRYSGILGADDRAGCAILWQLRNSGHSLLIVDGEESFMCGSRYLMTFKDIASEINNEHCFIMEFDRCNGHDFKTYNLNCPPEFIRYISDKTNFTCPDNWSFTDIVTLCTSLCGVNLSVGYYNEHTDSEYLNIDEWKNTLNICRDFLSDNYIPTFKLNPEIKYLTNEKIRYNLFKSAI